MSRAAAAMRLFKSGLIGEASEIRCYIGFYDGEHVFSLKTGLVASVDLIIDRVTSINPMIKNPEFANAIIEWRRAAQDGTEAKRNSCENTARAMELQLVTGKFYCACCMQERPNCKLSESKQ